MTLLSTTDNLYGYVITQYHGIVSSEIVLGTNIVRDMIAGITDVIGGRSGMYESSLADAKQTVLKTLQVKAEDIGANAVIGIDLDFTSLFNDKKQMLMCVGSGTAVSVEKR